MMMVMVMARGTAMVMDDGVDSNFGGDSEIYVASVEGINLGVDKVVVVIVGVYKRYACSRAGAGQQAQSRFLVSRHGRHGTGGKWFRNPFSLVARLKKWHKRPLHLSPQTAWGNWKDVKHLNLSENRMTVRGVRLLLSRTGPSISELDVSGNDLGECQRLMRVRVRQIGGLCCCCCF